MVGTLMPVSNESEGNTVRVSIEPAVGAAGGTLTVTGTF